MPLTREQLSSLPPEQQAEYATLLDQHVELERQIVTIQFYPNELSLAALDVLRRWSRNCKGMCPNFAAWLDSFVAGEVLRRAAPRATPTECDLPTLDPRGWEMAELVAVMGELYSMTAAALPNYPPLARLLLLLFSKVHCAALSRLT